MLGKAQPCEASVSLSAQWDTQTLTQPGSGLQSRLSLVVTAAVAGRIPDII